jgi:hypothetical protein
MSSGPVWVKINCCEDCPADQYGECDVSSFRTYPPEDCPYREDDVVSIQDAEIRTLHAHVAQLKAEVERHKKELANC